MERVLAAATFKLGGRRETGRGFIGEVWNSILIIAHKETFQSFSIRKNKEIEAGVGQFCPLPLICPSMRMLHFLPHYHFHLQTLQIFPKYQNSNQCLQLNKKCAGVTQ